MSAGSQSDRRRPVAYRVVRIVSIVPLARVRFDDAVAQFQPFGDGALDKGSEHRDPREVPFDVVENDLRLSKRKGPPASFRLKTARSTISR